MPSNSHVLPGRVSAGASAQVPSNPDRAASAAATPLAAAMPNAIHRDEEGEAPGTLVRWAIASAVANAPAVCPSSSANARAAAAALANAAAQPVGQVPVSNARGP